MHARAERNCDSEMRARWRALIERGNAAGAILVWDLATRRPCVTLGAAHPAGVIELAFVHDAPMRHKFAHEFAELLAHATLRHVQVVEQEPERRPSGRAERPRHPAQRRALVHPLSLVTVLNAAAQCFKDAESLIPRRKGDAAQNQRPAFVPGEPLQDKRLARALLPNYKRLEA